MASPLLQKLWSGLCTPFGCIYNIFSKPGKAVWRDSGYWLLFNLFGGLMPFWGGAFFLKFFTQEISYKEFISHGEFVLYSASFLAPALFLVFRDGKTSVFYARMAFGLTLVFGMVLAALAFAAVQAVGAVKPGEPTPLKLNEGFLIYASIILFAASTGLAFWVTILDGMRLQVDVQDQLSQGQRKLEEEFERLRRPQQ